MPDGVPPAVARSFAAMIPAILTLTIFALLNAFVIGVFNTNLYDVVYEVIQKPLVGLGSGLPATLIALFFVQFLWFFGLHGQILVNSVMDPIWNTLMLDNLEAKAGQPLPHIITKPFMEIFTVGMGGSGMTLMVVILMAFFMKSRQLKDVGRLALGPGIFNVNEPVILDANGVKCSDFYSLDYYTVDCNNLQLPCDGSWYCAGSNRCFCAVDSPNFHQWDAANSILGEVLTSSWLISLLLGFCGSHS